ncbi:MAG: ABC transporter ATP-binding protein [Ruminococcaceae bacterium]|nr:ABC transporter ATP-binding protein [Oscillospiraceae bacterium]
MIKIENLKKTYNSTIGECKALKGVDLEINNGEFLAVMGKSGAGKSTLLHIIGCIDKFDSGSVIVDGLELSKLNDKKMAVFRNKTIGIVLQDFALIPEYTIYENVSIPLLFSKSVKGKIKRKEAVENALKEVGMYELRRKKIAALSGGQKQRVAIARAIVNDPAYILADEPTGALDKETSGQIMSLFSELNAKGKTVIIITHDVEIASVCKRIITIEDGRIIKDDKR